MTDGQMEKLFRVSTHSRPKAAAADDGGNRAAAACFNTQPPEGGWSALRSGLLMRYQFQHTAARRRLLS